MILEGVLFTPDVPNKNGRVYPWALVKKVLEQVQVKIKDRAMLGQFILRGERQMDRALHHAALVVRNVYAPKNKDEVRATVELLTDAPRGKMAAHHVMVAGLVNQESPGSSEIRLRPFGTGRIEDNVVVEYELEGVDIEIVHKPLTPPDRKVNDG